MPRTFSPIRRKVYCDMRPPMACIAAYLLAGAAVSGFGTHGTLAGTRPFQVLVRTGHASTRAVSGVGTLGHETREC